MKEDNPVSWLILLGGATTIFMITHFLLGFTGQQALATSVVAFMILTTLTFWRMRVPIAFLGVAFLFATGLMTIPGFAANTKIDIIVFLMSMMIVIGHLEEQHFFDYVIIKLVNFAKNEGTRIIIIIMALSAVSAALVDEVTSILFMTTIVLQLAKKLDINPIPFILMVVFGTNIGSSATVVGNPIGVMIAFEAGLSFGDFLRVMTPIAILSMIVLIAASFFIFRKHIAVLKKKLQEAKGEQLFEEVEAKNLRRSAIFLILILLGLVTHTLTENLLGLEKNTLLLGVAMGGAGIALFFERLNTKSFFERRVEWRTLIFFMLLFSSVGALRATGVTDVIATNILAVAGDDPFFQMFVFLMVGGLMSAALDNVIAVAILIPIVHSLGDILGSTEAIIPIWWTLVIAGTYIGNLTQIGSTANIVAIGMLERRGYKHINFKTWIKYGAPIVLITTTVAFALLYAQVFLLNNY